MSSYSDPDKVLTLADWEDADMVSGACNLSGVAHSFPKVIKKVRAEATARGEDWEWAHHHPIVLIFVEKIVQLSRMTSAETWDAYEMITQKIKELA